MWVSSVSSCDIVPCPFPDHCAVILCVSVPDVVPPGPGLWKLNISVLEEEEYVNLISNFWTSWRGQRHLFPSPDKCGRLVNPGSRTYLFATVALGLRRIKLIGTFSLGLRPISKIGSIRVNYL